MRLEEKLLHSIPTHPCRPRHPYKFTFDSPGPQRFQLGRLEEEEEFVPPVGGRAFIL